MKEEAGRNYDISIVTPTLNAEKYISKCIDSVNSQNGVSIQHIIVDGESSDKTIEIAKEKGSDVYTLPKSSIYEALNHGIEKARSSIIGFINADDKYACEDALSTIVKKFSETKMEGIIYGNCQFVDVDGNLLYKLLSPKKMRLWPARHRMFSISHPSWFISADVIRKLECYDIKLRFVSDCDLIIRALEENVNFKYIDKDIAEFTLHETNASGTQDAAEEADRYIKQKNGDSRFNKLIFYFLIILLYSRDPRYFVNRIKRFFRDVFAK